MNRSSELSRSELNKRAEKVFVLKPGDYIYSIILGDDGTLIVTMEEVRHGPIFEYLPDMSGRPEAVAYLMGDRDDFND